MIASFTFIVLSFLVTLLIAPFLIDLLYQFKIVRGRNFDDTLKIKGRKDKIGTPMMGGIIIIISVIIITTIFNWNKYTQIPILIFLIGSVLGAIDDLLNIFGKKKRKFKSFSHHLKLALYHKKISKRILYIVSLPWALYKSLFNSIGSRYGTGLYPHERILIQFIEGAIVSYYIYFTLHIDKIWIFPNTYINLGWGIVILIFLIIIATANAVNITDGLDGLSAGVMLASFITFMTIALFIGNESIAILCATISGALLVYIYFNIKPARVQMGDIGTLGLGSLLAVISIILQREVILIIVGGIFVVETLSVIIQKISKRFFNKKVFLMSPLHHHLELKGWSEEKIVMRFWLFSFILAIIAIWVSII
jgi:phospho-N-acetylmuramoyl-pentapeptide-transferase